MINPAKFNKNKLRPKILIAPLDWGLGHATRCIPIICELIKQDCEIFIAAEEKMASLLKKEFPGIVILRLRGYHIHYSHKAGAFAFNILLQLPKVFFIILYEKKWLTKMVKRHHIDAVVSDNRPGMFCKNIPCIYITHQLFIKTGNRLSEKIARKIHYYFIKKYTACWVPDFKENGLAGILSHPGNIPLNVRYIGALSRFQKISGVKKNTDLLILISGPEPQRTIFEKIILSQLNNYTGKVVLVRGLPSEKEIVQSPNESVKIVNHLTAPQLNQVLEESQMVISRSGYTTIMDLVKLGKSAILVPTPGQEEQEYLARYLSEKKLFYATPQETFYLPAALKNAGQFISTCLDTTFWEHKKVINEFVLSLKTGNFAPQ